MRTQTSILISRDLLRAPDDDAPLALVAASAHDSRRLLSHALRGCGFEVVTVRDDHEALARISDFLLGAQARTFDLVVIDLSTRQRSGLSLLLSLRYCDCPPVIAILPDGDEELHEEVERRGAFIVLSWPLSFDELRKVALAVREPTRQRKRS
jgi:DNA-binding response OmpR family regulator